MELFNEVKIVTPDGLGFKGCPNKCENGYYFDPYTHKRKECQHCKELRDGVVSNTVQTEVGEDINTKLNIPLGYSGVSYYDFNTILPDVKENSNITPESKKELEDTLKNLYTDTLNKAKPTNSMLFNLGFNAYLNNFIFPYMLQSYKAGIDLAPYLTAKDIYTLLTLYETKETHKGVTYTDLLEKELSIVYINTGTLPKHIKALKGYMQDRAFHSKPTIIFTDEWANKHTQDGYEILSLYTTNPLDYSRATLVTVKYNSEPEPVKQISSKDFSSMMKQSNIL